MGRTGRRGLGLALVAVGLSGYLLVGNWRGDRDWAGSEPGVIVASRDAAPRSSEAVGASPTRDEVSGSRFVSRPRPRSPASTEPGPAQ